MPSSGVKQPGTFAGVIEKIPYLKALGVTAVELLPVFEFDETECIRQLPDGRRLFNFWGYSTVSFFAPHRAYCTSPEEGTHLTEFRDMVKALHQAGIEVILDVVFNHTTEGNHDGPTINFKGFDNSIYYHTVPDDRQYYMDYSGCGNTLNCNHPITEKMIVECLEYWVREMHVDGFRFDEGSILARGQSGEVLAYPPVIWEIELSETLADTKIIAEAWDAAGLYQIGYFPGFRWAEWNGKFRDDIRQFLRGDGGLVGAVAKRIAGSADLYQTSGHLPINSINFINCHDGFTLNDTVSLQREAQLGQRRGEQRRRQRQHVVELRRRRADRRSGHRGAAQPPDQECVRDADAVARRPDVRGGRRDPPHAGRQQQRVLPGQRDQLVRLVAAGQARRRAALLPADDRLPQADEHGAQAALLHRRVERARAEGPGLARHDPRHSPAWDDPERPRGLVHHGAGSTTIRTCTS